MPEPIKIGGLPLQSEDIDLKGRTYLLYGPFGSGKSHLAATASEEGKCLWIITDSNADSILLKFPSENVERVYIHRFIMKDALVMDPETKKPIKTRIKAVNPLGFDQYIDIIDDLYRNNCYDYDFIITDSFTVLNEMCMDMVQLKNKGEPIVDAPQIQHYGHQIRNLMAHCGESLQQLAKVSKVTCIAICHDRAAEDKLLGTIGVWPALTGQAGRTIGRTFEEVYYMRAVVAPATRSKTEFEARTRGTQTIAAKTQIDALPDVIPHANLNMKYIIDTREKFVESLRAKQRARVAKEG